MEKPKKIQFRDLTLRDGQQSLAATRMTTPQTLRALNIIKDVGFPYLELWGGATLDSAIRFMDEDPFERLETFREVLGEDAHKIQALIRGQNLFAYEPYPDDLVIAFTRQAIESGVHILRMFDALNDWRNLQIPLLAAKAYGAQVEGALSYTVSPVHTVDYFVDYAQRLESEGVDQIVIKDMAGILYPWDAVQLYQALKETLTVPISIHSHDTAGVGTFNAVLAMLHGIDTIDSCITPFASGPSHPPVELLVVFAEALGLEHGLDKTYLLKAQASLFELFHELKAYIPYYGKYYHPVTFADFDPHKVEAILKFAQEGSRTALEQGMQLTQSLLAENGYPPHDERIFNSQIPGGMLTNLQDQLSKIGQTHLLDAIMEEIPRVRAMAGYPPLVTPTSQIIGSQATYNVITGQPYQSVSNEFKMLLRGAFGRTPAPIDADLIAQILDENETRIHYRPASYLHPVLEDDPNLPYVNTQKERLLHHMLGQPADDFLRSRYGDTRQQLEQLMDGAITAI